MSEVKSINHKIHEITESGKYAHEALMFTRIVIGCVFIYHSLSKFGGAGSFMLLIGVVELIGGIFILMGYKIRIASSALGLIMIGAIYNKMFVWGGGFSGKGGWELDLVILALLFVMVSIDSTKYRISKRYK